MAEYLIQDSTLIAIADEIRAKTGKTDVLTLHEMISEISNIEVGEELNFTVVGGTTEPSNPTENMIWVNTDVEITGYHFSANEPENIVDGEVWICTGDSSNVAFNIVDGVQICPINAK